jgi:hypothetical protein
MSDECSNLAGGSRLPGFYDAVALDKEITLRSGGALKRVKRG